MEGAKELSFCMTSSLNGIWRSEASIESEREEERRQLQEKVRHFQLFWSQDMDIMGLLDTCLLAVIL